MEARLDLLAESLSNELLQFSCLDADGCLL